MVSAPAGRRTKRSRWERLTARVEPRVETALARGQRTRTRVLQRIARTTDRAPGPVQVLIRLVVRTVRDSAEDRVPGLAAEAALFTLISLPALILVVLGSLGYVAGTLGPAGAAELDRLVFSAPQTMLSSGLYDAYERIARQVLANGRADVIGFGLLVGLWTGSRAMSRFLETIAIAYDLPSGRARWKQRVLAFVLTVAGLLGAVGLLPLLVLGPDLWHVLAPEGLADATLAAFGWAYWPTMGALLLAALATLYHVGVPWHTPWIRDLPGAALALALWFAAAGALRAYLALTQATTVGDSVVYQQLGTPIAVVLWLWVSSMAVLLGGELNAEIEKMWPTIDPAEQTRS